MCWFLQFLTSPLIWIKILCFIQHPVFYRYEINVSSSGEQVILWPDQDMWCSCFPADEEVISGFWTLGVSAIPSKKKEGCVPAVCTKDRYLCSENAEVGVVSNGASALWKAILHPIQANLSQAILRDHYQLLVWDNDEVTNPTLPSPEILAGRRMKMDRCLSWCSRRKYLPCKVQMRQGEVLNKPLQCRKTEINCTHFCSCSDSGELCEDLDGDDDDGYDDGDCNGDDDEDEEKDFTD